MRCMFVQRLQQSSRGQLSCKHRIPSLEWKCPSFYFAQRVRPVRQVAVKGRLREADVALLPHSRVSVHQSPTVSPAHPDVRGATAHSKRAEDVANGTASNRTAQSLFTTVGYSIMQHRKFENSICSHDFTWNPSNTSQKLTSNTK